MAKDKNTETCGVAEIAKLCDADQEEIKSLVKQKIIPEETKGRFIPSKAITAYIKYLKEAPGAGQIIDGELCVSSKILRTIFKVEESTIVRWGQKDCPKKGRGLWAISEVLKWRGLITSDGIKTVEDIKEKSLFEQKMHFETRLKESQAEAIELKNAISKGDYIPKTEIVDELKRFFGILKKSCQGLSNKIAMELVPLVGQIEARKIERLASDILNDALEQLSINGVYVKSVTTKALKKANIKTSS